ncbi:MAG: CoA transferase [Reyranella sp.]|nr:CoA transferase [Reyranella sp.]MDP3159601.1 CoA transferase [Reyranella sp.]
MEKIPEGALAGIRVLDIATFLAAPFCGTVMADFGAEVLKVEMPKVGDPLRRFGTETACKDTFVWMSEARNKKSITLDLRQPKGVELLRKLVAQSDVVIENFRTGTLEKWGIGYEDLKRVNPKIIMLRITGYGQTGPYNTRPGFARIAHAFSGLANLAGEPGRIPVMPGSTSLADYMSGVWGALGVLMALRSRDRTGVGQFIDIGLYESTFRMMDEMASVYAHSGFVRERMGPDTVNIVPHSHYETKDGRWVAIACSSDKMFTRLAHVMGDPDLAAPDRFEKMDDRLAEREKVNGIVSDWTRSYSADDIVSKCNEGGVPCSILMSIKDIFEDPHYQERGNLVTVNDPRIGDVVVPVAVPRLSGTPGRINHLGPALGSSNDEIYRGLLGIDDATYAELEKQGAI